jgi:hypothetical protein
MRGILFNARTSRRLWWNFSFKSRKFLEYHLITTTCSRKALLHKWHRVTTTVNPQENHPPQLHTYRRIPFEREANTQKPKFSWENSTPSMTTDHVCSNTKRPIVIVSLTQGSRCISDSLFPCTTLSFCLNIRTMHNSQNIFDTFHLNDEFSLNTDMGGGGDRFHRILHG